MPSPTSHSFNLTCANIVNGRYRYTDDLLQLAAATVPQPRHCWPSYHTPIQVDRLVPFLNSHPDKAFATYILDGLTNGFRIGFNYRHCSLHSCGSNHPSSLVNEKVVDDRIAAEVTAGRLFGPLPIHLKSQVHVSPMGLVPKPHQANKFRLIVDLSHPAGASVNDGISPTLCSLHYTSVDEAVSIIKQLGRGTQLVKLDIKDAYRIIPVHPADYHLLGISWRGETYIDRALPFGLRSAPKIFSAVADLISWVIHQQGVRHHLHYLDDFLLLGAPGSEQAQNAMVIVLRLFDTVGIPIASHKTEGPATSLSFLGILIDTQAFELRLPAEKLSRLQETLHAWADKKSCTRRELESLLGHLSHAASVISQGRTFLRQLFPLLSLDRASHHYIRLNAGARADLTWWRVFLQDWNGTSFFPTMATAAEVTSDASGAYGCGAFSSSHGWFQLQWPDSWSPINIAVKELVPIVMAAAIWGHHWQRSCVRFRSDNMAVVNILNSRTSKDQLLMHLLRCLVFYSAFFRFQFVAEHVPGILNVAADAISRNNLPLFFSIFPQIPRVAIPQSVLDLLVTRRPNWGSRDWTRLFVCSLTGGLQMPHVPFINQAGGNTPGSAHSTHYPLCRSPSTPSVSLPQSCPNQ